MIAASARNLLFGALLLVCAWVPAATLAAPHARSAAESVEAPAHEKVRAVRHLDRVATVDCPRTRPTRQS